MNASMALPPLCIICIRKVDFLQGGMGSRSGSHSRRRNVGLTSQRVVNRGVGGNRGVVGEATTAGQYLVKWVGGTTIPPYHGWGGGGGWGMCVRGHSMSESMCGKGGEGEERGLFGQILAIIIVITACHSRSARYWPKSHPCASPPTPRTV